MKTTTIDDQGSYYRLLKLNVQLGNWAINHTFGAEQIYFCRSCLDEEDLESILHFLFQRPELQRNRFKFLEGLNN